mmetsp:Transcript_5764/g.17661  ORF Transcript_5764/g.17661 Transcript_5764/m.17661 type:complete len:718 (+) Transcript_5764:182-2335(+)|eukprot:CAMPEP_0174233900 /NCGR_PEP_ID=MMETSP0417-20130205/3817_1 /TAXON_ID=242541 /ORGANISM="Mayorella sp, Strain BSH-02190019" /LENGTH=717 /DNA_ID=CAMNT_0015312193 /DNA_START=162 /DNA_END=2315 /DNA_ORIENTATION=+
MLHAASLLLQLMLVAVLVSPSCSLERDLRGPSSFTPFDYNRTVFVDVHYGARSLVGYERKLVGYTLKPHSSGGVHLPAPSPYWCDLGGIEGVRIPAGESPRYFDVVYRNALFSPATFDLYRSHSAHVDGEADMAAEQEQRRGSAAAPTSSRKSMPKVHDVGQSILFEKLTEPLTSSAFSSATTKTSTTSSATTKTSTTSSATSTTPWSGTVNAEQLAELNRIARSLSWEKRGRAGTIVHVHGLTPPCNLDGVPYITAPPIFPGQSFHYRYQLDERRNNGTYWAHSHYSFQACNGLAFPVIVDGLPAEYPLADLLGGAQQQVLLLQDVCPSYAGNGPVAADQDHCSQASVFAKLQAAWNNSQSDPLPECPDVTAATAGDVAFEAYVLNSRVASSPYVATVPSPRDRAGRSNKDQNQYQHQYQNQYQDQYKVQNQYKDQDQDQDRDQYQNQNQYQGQDLDSSATAAQTPVWLRIINASGMTNYLLQLPVGLNCTLVAVDGQWVWPLVGRQFWIGVAQRLDILVVSASATGGSFPVVFYAESSQKSRTSGMVLNFGHATETVSLPLSGDPVGFMATQTEQQLQAFYPLVPREADRVLFVNLTGDNGFASINHRSFQLYPEGDGTPNPHPLRVQFGERVHMVIRNNNADNHAMHLHGHSFQVISIDDVPVNGAMRDTVVVPGGCHSVVIAFDAVNPGVWMFHCHMSFHLYAGMATTVEYES